jgi:hypothetical protein
MSRDSHQDGADDEHYDIHLQCPLAANTLSQEVAEQGTEECTRLESRGDVTRNAGSCGFGDAKVLLEARTGDCCTHEG